MGKLHHDNLFSIDLIAFVSQFILGSYSYFLFENMFYSLMHHCLLFTIKAELQNV